jgi:hypothetical protein
MNCWEKLDVAQTADKREIKRAYAKLIKLHSPEDDPAEFQAIREAYDMALALAESRQYGLEQANLGAPTEPAPHAKPANRSELALSEKNQVRSRQSKRIEETLGNLTSLLAQDESAAVDLCRQELKSEFYQALDARHEFEGRLVCVLAHADNLPLNFMGYLAREFQWEIGIPQHGRPIANRFADIRYGEGFYVLIERYQCMLARQALKENLRATNNDISTEQLDKVDALLFDATSLPALADFCSSERNKILIALAYNFLVARKFVTANSSLVPWQAIHWLVDRKIVAAVRPAVSVNDGPSAADNNELRFPYWIVGVLAFIVLRVMSSLGQHGDSKSILDAPDSHAAQPSQTDQSPTLILNASTEQQRQYSLALKFLRSGPRLKKEMEAGLSILQRLANEKYAPAQETLGALYYTGEAGPQNYGAAVMLLTKAATGGSADANYWLFRVYNDAKAVPRDQAKANQFLDSSVQLGSALGMHAKGFRIISGRDTEKDPAKGEQYLRQAAEMGNLTAAYQLALQYLTGEYLESDYVRARSWLEFLASRRIPAGQLWLGHLYQKGLGVPQDSARAAGLVGAAKATASPEVINQVAWLLATNKKEQLRNGQLAVDLMEYVLSDAGNSQASRLDTLAAAYAAAGDFDKAVRMQQRALDKLPTTSTAERLRYESRLALYRQRKAFVEL